MTRWPEVKSHLVCHFVRGLSSSQLELNNTGEGVRYLRTSDLLEDLAITKFDDRFCADPPPGTVYKRPGEMALTIEGFSRPDGRSTIGVPCWEGEGILNNHCVLVRPRSAGVFGRFAQYAHATTAATDLLKAAGTGAIAASAGPMLGELRMPLPPLREQRAIADFLDAETARIDALIAKKRQLADRLGEHLQSLANQIIGKQNGASVPLMHRTEQQRPIMYGIVLPGPDVGTGVPIVKGGDVAANRLAPPLLSHTTSEIEAPYARARLRAGDILFAIRGGIGDVQVVPPQLENANITQDVARVAPAPGVDSTWLKAVLQSQMVQDQVRARITGATVRGLNIWELQRVRVPASDQQRQEEDLRMLRPAMHRRDRLIACLDRQIGLLRERRQALITAAVSGELALG